MTYEQLLRQVREGNLSQAEIRDLVVEFAAENPNFDWAEAGSFGDDPKTARIVQSGAVTSTQLSAINNAFQDVTGEAGSFGSQVGELAALAGGRIATSAVSGLFGRSGGATISDVVGGEVIERATTAAERSLARKVGSFLTGIRAGRGGLNTALQVGGRVAVAGAGTAFLQGAFEGSGAGSAPPGSNILSPEAQRGPISQEVVLGQLRSGGETKITDKSKLVPQQARPGFNVLVVDHSGKLTGTPGALAVITPEQLGMTSDANLDIAGMTSSATPTGSAGEFLSQFFAQNPQAVTGSRGEQVRQVIFPQTVGQMLIDTPTTVGRTLRDIFRANEASMDPRDQESKAEIARANRSRPEVALPAGAKVESRIFQNYKGLTLIEHAARIAQKYKVPLNLLYGVISHESGWNPNAVGDNGTSFGLAQIHLTADAYGGSVSRGQALDPFFALNWTAQKLAQRFAQYGRWDAAVAAHNSPVAAEYLARTGKFQTDKSARYTSDILSRANASGLSDWQFDEGLDTPIDDGTGSGVTYTPFQAPDPKASEDYVETVYMELLGRKPTAEEIKAGVSKVGKLARKAYNANLTQAKGGESTGVDIQAQFEQDLKEGGEFAFHEETQQLDSFTNYAAGLARMLQTGAS